MKSSFFPFIKPTEQEFKDLWNDCIFTFDANILLNFYRYKTESTNIFFNFLNKLDERIFITYQACQEYFERRLDVISEQEKAYLEMSNALENTIESPLHNSRKHPYISIELLEELAVVSKKVKDELNARSKEYSQRLAEDDILNRIITIFDGKVGEAFSEKRLSEVFQEGDKRYQNNIPPGFKDKQKGGTRQYGDLVLWFQIIEFAKQQGRDIIFISDDAKEDWVLSHKGRTIGLLPDLQKEFNLLTGKRIHLYNASRFTELASEFLDTEVSEETIKDIGSLQNDATPVLEADLVWQSSGRFNNGFSQKNVEKYGSDPIPVGSPLIIYWQLDWRFALIIYNNSSYPAYNIKIEADSDIAFSSISQLPKINNLPPFAKLELEAKTVFYIEGEHTEADTIIKERIPKHLEGLRLKITFLDEQRFEHKTIVSIQNREVLNTPKN